MRKLIVSLLIVILMSVIITGGTFAIFSDSEEIQGNYITTATVDLTLNGLDSGELEKPLVITNLLPGEWSQWGRVELFNTNLSSEVNVFMYVNNVSGAACDKINLKVTAGHAGTDQGERANLLYYGALQNLESESNRIEITVGFPFHTLDAGLTQVIQQQAQLDDSADNSYQNTNCSWDEVFVAENVIP